jgi:hypothetical protein
MTVRQVGNVVANENREVTPGTSSPQALQEAKTAQANAVMNADYQYGANRQNVVANLSKDGRPTLEYQPATGGSKTLWIRYNP